MKKEISQITPPDVASFDGCDERDLVNGEDALDPRELIDEVLIPEITDDSTTSDHIQQSVVNLGANEARVTVEESTDAPSQINSKLDEIDGLFDLAVRGIRTSAVIDSKDCANCAVSSECSILELLMQDVASGEESRKRIMEIKKATQIAKRAQRTAALINDVGKREVELSTERRPQARSRLIHQKYTAKQEVEAQFMELEPGERDKEALRVYKLASIPGARELPGLINSIVTENFVFDRLSTDLKLAGVVVRKSSRKEDIEQGTDLIIEYKTVGDPKIRRVRVDVKGRGAFRSMKEKGELYNCSPGNNFGVKQNSDDEVVIVINPEGESAESSFMSGKQTKTSQGRSWLSFDQDGPRSTKMAAATLSFISATLKTPQIRARSQSSSVH